MKICQHRTTWTYLILRILASDNLFKYFKHVYAFLGEVATRLSRLKSWVLVAENRREFPPFLMGDFGMTPGTVHPAKIEMSAYRKRTRTVSRGTQEDRLASKVLTGPGHGFVRG